MKFALVIILLMATLQFIPPLFVGTDYSDNAYYTALYALLFVTSLSLPFLIETMPKYWKYTFMLFSGWYISGFYFEVVNWDVPDIIINSMDNTAIFSRYSMAFIFAVLLIILNEIWHKKSHPNT